MHQRRAQHAGQRAASLEIGAQLREYGLYCRRCSYILQGLRRGEKAQLLKRFGLRPFKERPLLRPAIDIRGIGMRHMRKEPEQAPAGDLEALRSSGGFEPAGRSEEHTSELQS